MFWRNFANQNVQEIKTPSTYFPPINIKFNSRRIWDTSHPQRPLNLSHTRTLAEVTEMHLQSIDSCVCTALACEFEAMRGQTLTDNQCSVIVCLPIVIKASSRQPDVQKDARWRGNCFEVGEPFCCFNAKTFLSKGAILDSFFFKSRIGKICRNDWWF